MLEAILDNSFLAFLLIAAGLVVAYGCVVLLTALLEKQPIEIFVPPRDGQPPRLTAYASAMNEAAAEAGFESYGTYEHAKGGTYKLHGTLWLSPTRDMMALVCGGTMIKINYRKTVLYSRLPEERYLATSDEFGEPELSDLTIRQTVVNADFPELLEHHQRRLASLSVLPLPVTSTDPWNEFYDMEYKHACRLVEFGYVRFLDPAQTTSRYTLKGASLIAMRSQTRMWRTAKGSKHRANIKRPGDRGYVPSASRRQARSKAAPPPEQPPAPAVARKLQSKHTRYGLASCVLAAVALALALGAIILAGTAAEGLVQLGLAIIILLVSMLIALIGLILAIVGLAQQNRKKLTPLAGLLANALFLILLITALLLV